MNGKPLSVQACPDRLVNSRWKNVLPAAALPSVFSQMTSPGVSHAGIAGRAGRAAWLAVLARVAVPARLAVLAGPCGDAGLDGSARAAAGSRIVAATAPATAVSRRAARVLSFMRSPY